MIHLIDLIKNIYKSEDNIREEMTASSGAISGMGYNFGGPPPDDVAVSKEAQANYTSGNAHKSSPILTNIIKRKKNNSYYISKLRDNI
jgi:hypothetical protein